MSYASVSESVRVHALCASRVLVSDEQETPDDRAPDVPTLIRAELLVAGLVWTHTARLRRPDDIKSFRATDNPLQRRAQGVVWMVSAGIMIGVIADVGGLLRALVQEVM